MADDLRDKAMALRRALFEARDERDAAKAEIERLRDGREIEQTMLRNAVALLQEIQPRMAAALALHQSCADEPGCFDADPTWCHECGKSYPCPTRRALEEVQP